MTDAKPPVRVGVIGLGRMGQNHVRVLSLLNGADLRFVYDIDGAAAQRVGNSYGVAAAQDFDAATP